MSIYFNNAATTWPKPECVAQAMSSFLLSGGANLGRGTSSARDLSTMNTVLECRERIAELLGGYENASPVYVTFTSGVTESLNIVLKGFLKPGMRVVTSSMEHNAVIRPLRRLEAQGVKLEILKCDPLGFLDMQLLKSALEQPADLVIMSHCSNVCGSVLDIESAAEICRAAGMPLVIDTAQTAGLLPLNAQKLGLAALCFTGHKGLMGPQGTGGIVWNPEFAKKCAPLCDGGTGSFSHVEVQPEAMPDRFEAGTQNLPGIAGLSAAVRWISETGIDTIRRHENELGVRLLEGLKQMPGMILYGLPEVADKKRLAVYAVNFEGVDNGILAAEMSERGLEARPGLQCSPWGHKTLGCFPQGALRLSLGYFNTPAQIDQALQIIEDSLKAVRKN
jgi:cysteine desulfurase family protein